MMLEKLNEYYEKGLLHKQVHPILPLIVWNYTPKVQYENLFDEVTTKCRGLVTDNDGNIVARCVPKFFNWEQLQDIDIPKEPFTITDKMDGSYISIFRYLDTWVFASRGSFISDQAIMAREIFDKKYSGKVRLHRELTYILEYIGPSNRIVVQYPEDDLVLLTAYETATGEEVSIYDPYVFAGFNLVKTYNGYSDFNDIKTMISDEAEGYVVRFKNGFRMKIKGEEYIRLHRILTNISNRDIWQYLKDGKPLDEILEKVPDEFYGWVKKTEADFKDQFLQIKTEVELTFKELVNKKEYAEKVKGMEYKHLLFRRLDSYSTQYEDMIWDKIYPRFEKPFCKNKNE